MSRVAERIHQATDRPIGELCRVERRPIDIVLLDQVPCFVEEPHLGAGVCGRRRSELCRAGGKSAAPVPNPSQEAGRGDDDDDEQRG